MAAAGNYPAANDLQAFYTAQNALWVVIGTAEGGLLRCIGNTSDFTDLFPPNDADLVRAWSLHELGAWFVNNYVYENYLSTQQGANFTVSFTVDALPFSGTANREVDAFAIAIIALLSSPAARKPKTVDLSELPKTSKKPTKK